MDRLLRSAQFTLDLAAPVEHARTPLHHRDLLCPVAAATAHEIASVHAEGRVVALPAVRPLDP